MPHSTKNANIIQVCIECKAENHMKNAWGTTEKESIYGFCNSINCLSCECVRLMFFLKQQNLIKSKCWDAQTYTHVHILFAFSLHFGASECQNYHKHAFNFWGSGRDWFEWVQLIWKVHDEKLCSCVCECECITNEKDTNFYDEPHNNSIWINCLLLFIEHIQKLMRTHAQYWRITSNQKAIYMHKNWIECNSTSFRWVE